mmetsp:Transcript_75914/g.167533  ORF Transcript_75914/g.167533 Transcript_75914/m.167533 type:complete len:109 (-) Transcript_75914:161-487(-)
MLGIKYNVFRKAQSFPLLRYWYRRAVRFDERSGLLTAGLPLTVTLFAAITVTTIILDRQLEMRDMRARSISRREATLEEEHRAMREFLKGTEDEYEMKQIPDTYRIGR